MAAGTCTTTEVRHTSVKKISFDWLAGTGDDEGTVTATTTYAYDGVLERVVFVPDSGDTQPDNLYDVVVNDADSHDVLAGLGANLSNAATATKTHADGLGAVAGSKLTLSVSGAGSANGGIVNIYLR